MNPLHWILTTPEPEEAQGEEILQNVDHDPLVVNDVSTRVHLKNDTIYFECDWPTATRQSVANEVNTPDA
ncbi:hypothetical protein SUVC_05G2050 [Saccharomyces uvarum]|uniref:Uncharacterized protein n=1 Tax=Saccharomyces uvarum TaxID=230603 RepID=A0AA35NRZ1_SACUV|nr:hypothetical protein SUVC_05G2050 [Saccharomyces uvarum]